MRIILTFALIAGITSVVTTPAFSVDPTPFTFPCSGGGTYTVEYAGEPTETPTSGGTLTDGSSCAGAAVIDSSVEIITYAAFDTNRVLTEITLPESLVTFDGTFLNSSIETFTTYSSVTIPASLFQGSLKLRSVNILGSVETIGAYAFDSSGLTSITLPASLISIGEYAFTSSGLTSITLPEGLVSIGAYAFQGTNNLTSITLPASLRSIGDSAFASSGLTSITLPEGLANIGDSAFYATTNLTSITLPEGLVSILDYTFSNTGLLSITLPSSLVNIGEYAFDNAIALSSVTYYGLESPDSASVIATLKTFPCSWDYTDTAGGTPACNPVDYPPLVVTVLSRTGDDGAGALATATTAVILAESSDLQSDLSAAQILVTALSSSAGKDALQVRIGTEVLVISRAVDAARAAAIVAAAAARLAALNAAASALAAKAAQNATKDLEAFVAPVATPGEPTKPAPSIDTYLSAGVKGVTVGNLDLVNILVKELASTQVTTKALVEIVKVATIVISFSIITNSAQIIIKKSELGSIGISTIAGKDLRAFTAYIATLPVGDRNTPVELVAAAEAFKVKMAADIQRVKDARKIARVANRAAIIAIFKAKR